MTSIRDIWAHYNNIFRATKQIVDARLRPLKLNITEGNILLHLWMRSAEGSAVSQEHLVQELDITKGGISRAVDALTEKGLVLRRRHPDDKRAYRLLLTEEALKVVPQVEKVYNGIYLQALEGLCQEELDSLFGLLGRIAGNLPQTPMKAGDGNG